VSLIVAADEDNGIGKNNELLCHMPADLAYFKRITSDHHIIMGRKTYDSIGRPLPNRTNVIITRDAALQIPGCVVVHSLEAAIEHAKANGETEAFITGGGTIYEQALPITDKIYLTRIHTNLDADTFFPELGSEWKLIKEEQHRADEKNKYDYSFLCYAKFSSNIKK
jgi:dihydrofolate reductase